jgi:predicted RNA-binding protein Jag
MSRIVITESQLKKLMEQNMNSAAMDLDIYSQPMETSAGNPNEEVAESAQQIIDYLEELISMMKGGKEVSNPLRQSIHKGLDDVKTAYENIKYGK